MIDRRIEETYGFGAARIALRGEAFNVGDPDHAVQRAAAIFVRDLREDGVRRVLTYSGAPLLGLALVVLLAVATLLVQPSVDDSDIEIVAFEVAQLPPLPLPVAEAPPAPTPIPEAQPPPAPVKTPEPRPAPPVAKVEPRVPVPAPPVVRPEPLPEVVKPVVRQPRAEPVPRAEPPPTRRPRVQIDSVAQIPERAAVPQVQKQRVVRSTAQPQRARVDVAPMAAAPLPQLAPEVAPTRKRFRVASSSPASSRPAVRVDPLPARIADAPLDATRDRVARQVPRPTAPSAERDRPRPSLAPATAQPAAPRDEPAPRARTARTAPQAAPAPSRRNANVGVPQLRAPSATASARPEARRVARVEPVVAPPSGRARGDQDGKLSGVPLGSLAACLTDRDEDALKQQVVSAVTTQKECLSGAGRYRFLQTKNLNSFLMWVDRAQGRAEADRCVELRYALDCLKRQARTGS